MEMGDYQVGGGPRVTEVVGALVWDGEVGDETWGRGILERRGSQR